MKLLLAGLGGIGQRHARNLRYLLGDSVDLLAWRVRGRGGVITESLDVDEGEPETRYGITPYSQLGAALAERPDGVLVCNPTALHISTALAAAEAGCHLFLEKPLSHTMEGVEDLRELVNHKGLVCVVGYQMRFHPCLQRLREIVQNRELGAILGVSIKVGDYLPSWHRYEDYRQSYAAQRELGGGVILSQIHEFDYARWLFGMPRQLLTVGGHVSALELDVEDTADTLMQCGTAAQPYPVHVHQDFLQRPSRRSCEIVGTDATAHLDFLEHALTVTKPSGQPTTSFSPPGFQRNDMFLAEMQNFLDCIGGRTTPFVTLDDGIQSLRIALAARESLATERAIDLGSAS